MLKGKNIISVHYLSQEEVKYILEKTQDIKQRPEDYADALRGKTMAMLFERQSLRTRASFETAMWQLGGHAMFIKCVPAELYPPQFGPELPGILADLYLKESAKDRAKVLSRFVDVVVYRTEKEETIRTFAKHASVPVINASSRSLHPCQGLTDLFTVYDEKANGDIGKLKELKYVTLDPPVLGVFYDFLYGATKLGMNVTISWPEMEEYTVTGLASQTYWQWATENAEKGGGTITVEHDPIKAVKDADVIYAGRSKDDLLSRPYLLDTKLLAHAKPDVIVLQCGPTARGVNLTDAVMDGPHSAIFDEAENRIHVQKAILVSIV